MSPPRPPMRRPALAALCGLYGLCVLLAACASLPDDAGRQDLGESPHAGFELQTLERTRQLMRQGHLGEAAVNWEVLTVLRPDRPDYARQLAQTRAQIERAATEHALRARQAQQKGDRDEAERQHLAVLALKPADATSADALRAIERERNQRDYLGRYSRLTLASRMAPGATRASGEAANDWATARNDLEHAALLAGQGEFDDAIALLRGRLKTNPKDAPARSLLADVYFHQGQAIAGVDKAGAMAALNQCLQLDPQHTAARARLAQLKARER